MQDLNYEPEVEDNQPPDHGEADGLRSNQAINFLNSLYERGNQKNL